MTTTPNNPATFACDMEAIAAADRPKHANLIAELFNRVQEIRELSDGYAFKFDSSVIPKIAEFISNERLCCPFFTFSLNVQPSPGDVLLQLTGPEGVKPFILAEIGSFIKPSLTPRSTTVD